MSNYKQGCNQQQQTIRLRPDTIQINQEEGGWMWEVDFNFTDKTFVLDYAVVITQNHSIETQLNEVTHINTRMQLK